MVTSKYICRKTVTDSGSGPFEVTDLNVGHLSDEEVTEGDPGESHAVRDVPAFPHPVQHLETEHVEHRTGTLPTQVRFSGAARYFLPQ